MTKLRRSMACSCRALLISLAVATASLPRPAGATATAATAAADDPWRGCTRSCGNISIAYPFGVEPGCYRDGFDLTCDRSHQPPKLFLGNGAAATEVTDISFSTGTVRIRSGFINITDLVLPSGNTTGGAGGDLASGTPAWGAGLRSGGPYFLSEERNKLVVVACNVQVLLLAPADGGGGDIVSACSALCPELDNNGGGGTTPAHWYLYFNGGCSGVGCCQATVPLGYTSYPVEARRLNGTAIATNIFYVAERGVNYTIGTAAAEDAPPAALPAVLEWVIGDANATCPVDAPAPECHSSQSYCQNSTAEAHRGYICRCKAGYDGNPYITDGCQDIDECLSPEIYPCFGECKNTLGGYLCSCPPGYTGSNASIPLGCKDIDECAHPDVYQCYGECINLLGTFDCRCPFGTHGNAKRKGGCISMKKSYTALGVGLGVGVGSALLLLAVSVRVMKQKFNLRKARKTKEKFFKQNHGLLLQQLVSQKADIAERMIITLEELEKATNNFDKNHEVGFGGHGTVYKGILDLNVVAVKRSKIIIQKEIDDFINEVAILSQINHRNVVRLLGCCLETEVPLLVYEFISNGNLSHHLHTKGPTKLSWDDRLRIALEVARALAYLHSAASIPIFHRDIKSSNILLHGNLTAKVSDFGASRYISLNRTEVTASIQGTRGYVDPTYYYTGKLTDKSDVFSFGVLLIELLTRKKPSVFTCNDGSLVAQFHSLLIEGNLVRIIDPQVTEEKNERVQEVAELAARCTQLKRQERPTMRQVEMELENLQANNTEARRCIQHHIVGQCVTAEAGFIREETSRQFSMEEEILLSAGYPR
ncbi:unnamed protein product [Urochloa decumbens]|uniref:Protein kinase domain-containing protein n=1 Tax=Urochloa decumbens TaxID=240449 RepID=A0ABC9BI06_9POAL